MQVLKILFCQEQGEDRRNRQRPHTGNQNEKISISKIGNGPSLEPKKWV